MSPKTMGTTLPLALIAALALSACASEPKSPPLVCAEDSIPDGEGGCVPAPPTCVPEVPGSIAADCQAQHRSCFEDRFGTLCGVCLSGFVEEGGACRELVSCEDLDCTAQGRSCVDGGARADAQCGSCLPGSSGLADRCVQRSCSLTEPEGSIAASCAAQNRSCIEAEGEEASCGGCYPGFVEEGGVCRLVRSCADLGCVGANRGCTVEGSNRDASCGGCRAGFSDRDGQCRAILNAICAVEGQEAATGVDIASSCAAEHRACDASGGAATCGDCEDGFVKDPRTGACQAFTSCESLDCGARKRSCAEDPQGRCGGCLPGFVEDPETGTCRQSNSCATIRCKEGEECVEATDETDALCRPACGAGEIWGGNQCTLCPSCTEEGEDGRWPLPTTAGSCICKTQPGYFYSTAGDVGTFPCDADDDGWVRDSARLGLESKDPALRANARCSLRTIDRVELQNEGGESREVILAQPLELYESDRNDDQALLDVQWRSKRLPSYAGGRAISARELNRMTKICHDRRADYNDNGIADVSEWSGHSLGPAMRPEHQPFNEFSYFVELYQGFFVAPAAGERHGRWVIREKSRLASPGGDDTSHVPLFYPESDGSYWRECKVDPDPRWRTANPPVGMDFARYTDPAFFGGMSHHSQFKCMVVDDEPTPGAPQEITPEGLSQSGYRLNRCSAVGAPVEPGDSNPAETLIDCVETAPTAVRPGDVVWGAVPYKDYGPTPYMSYDGADMGTAVYQGGCVNPCVEALPQCDFYSVNPIAVSCDRDPDNFGKFVACSSWEVCDGEDNDGDGVADNGNPGGGFPCDTNRVGICQAGTTNCRGGEIVCDQDTPESGERCNGLDDNCDGHVDETFPNEGLSCNVPDKLGLCKTGVYQCVDGVESCRQTVFPEQNETCDSLDHDCDGSSSTKGADPANGIAGSIEGFIGCTNYYYDGDGDGYPDQMTSPRCLCGPSGDYTYKEPSGGVPTNRWDCCDKDNKAFPGSTTTSSSPTKCGGYDYNCDGISERLRTDSYGGCKYVAFKGCKIQGSGWEGSVPQCGETGRRVYDCHYEVGGCVKDEYDSKQECK